MDPLRLARLAISALLAAGTIFALVLGLSGVDRRGLALAGAFWGLYGLYLGIIDGVLEPLSEFVVTAIQNVGLMPTSGYSGIETMVIRGHYQAAAEAYLERVVEGKGDAEALIRRAMLLAGPLGLPGGAAMELEEFRDHHHLGPHDDVRIGAALAQVYERGLGEPGRAMAELRRLIDRYPGARASARLRRALAVLREDRFGSGEPSAPGSRA